MKIIREILSYIFEPIKLSGNREISEKTAKFFNQKRIFIYIIAFVITLAIFIYMYI